MDLSPEADGSGRDGSEGEAADGGVWDMGGILVRGTVGGNQTFDFRPRKEGCFQDLKRDAVACRVRLEVRRGVPRHRRAAFMPLRCEKFEGCSRGGGRVGLEDVEAA